MNKLSALEPALTIVVADDDDALREMLSESLRAVGFRVDEVGDGEELRHYLEKANADGQLPRLVVSDHRMPRITGLEVLSWASKFVPQVPFILLSAFAAPQLHERALQVGARAVLDKPVDLRELRHFVVDLVSASTSGEPAEPSSAESSPADEPLVAAAEHVGEVPSDVAPSDTAPNNTAPNDVVPNDVAPSEIGPGDAEPERAVAAAAADDV